MGLDSVLSTIVNQISAAINSAGITQPSQTFKGWPTAPQLVEMLGQSNSQYVVSVYPYQGRNVTRWLDYDGYYIQPVVTLQGDIGPDSTVSFSLSTGTTMGALYNVHAFIKNVNHDFLVQPATTDNPDAVATALAGQVNALAVPGLSALASGHDVVLTGGQWQFCNVGGTGSLVVEANRVSRITQVSVWTTGDTEDTVDPDSSLRLAVYDAIASQVGTKDEHFYYDQTDGTPIFFMLNGDNFDDDSQSSYSLYVARLLYDMEYSINARIPATQVGAGQFTEQINSNPPRTIYTGG